MTLNFRPESYEFALEGLGYTGGCGGSQNQNLTGSVISERSVERSVADVDCNIISLSECKMDKIEEYYYNSFYAYAKENSKALSELWGARNRTTLQFVIVSFNSKLKAEQVPIEIKIPLLESANRVVTVYLYLSTNFYTDLKTTFINTPTFVFMAFHYDNSLVKEFVDPTLSDYNKHMTHEDLRPAVRNDVDAGAGAGKNTNFSIVTDMLDTATPGFINVLVKFNFIYYDHEIETSGRGSRELHSKYSALNYFICFHDSECRTLSDHKTSLLEFKECYARAVAQGSFGTCYINSVLNLIRLSPPLFDLFKVHEGECAKFESTKDGDKLFKEFLQEYIFKDNIYQSSILEKCAWGGVVEGVIATFLEILNINTITITSGPSKTKPSKINIFHYSFKSSLNSNKCVLVTPVEPSPVTNYNYKLVGAFISIRLGDASSHAIAGYYCPSLRQYRVHEQHGIDFEFDWRPFIGGPHKGNPKLSPLIEQYRKRKLIIDPNATILNDVRMSFIYIVSVQQNPNQVVNVDDIVNELYTHGLYAKQPKAKQKVVKQKPNTSTSNDPLGGRTDVDISVA